MEIVFLHSDNQITELHKAETINHKKRLTDQGIEATQYKLEIKD